eukprot:TRINITY_DN12866_c0_g1_i4.p1 TRINITY_DN12866_c0_g1~~TRINITY_DN12866_c0_g1_i4.p1  ORF type:complete len:239 (+),score=50.89 TRINITY_DN12866_c0_g1_i4:542-1258(+)
MISSGKSMLIELDESHQRATQELRTDHEHNVEDLKHGMRRVQVLNQEKLLRAAQAESAATREEGALLAALGEQTGERALTFATRGTAATAVARSAERRLAQLESSRDGSMDSARLETEIEVLSELDEVREEGRRQESEVLREMELPLEREFSELQWRVEELEKREEATADLTQKQKLKFMAAQLASIHMEWADDIERLHTEYTVEFQASLNPRGYASQRDEIDELQAEAARLEAQLWL